MFGYLPEVIKQQVLYHLQNQDFRAAKKLYDSWLHQNNLKQKYQQ